MCTYRLCGAAALALASNALAQENIHFSYLWHLEQPIYWPERQASGADRYERAWESIVHKDGGAAHPQDDLRSIFGLADRVAAYQYRIKDSISAISSAPEAGAQISYSGGLIENITSLGNAGQLGYGAGWFSDNRTARSWLTAAAGVNQPRLDIVNFSFHHALLPLLDDGVVRKEIQLYKAIYDDAWGAQTASRGFFPSEMAFSERLVPILASEGIAWSIVSAEKISRAYADFPVVFGSGGINCDPPNLADRVNGNGGSYYRVSISRGCAPAEAVPGALTPRRAKYVDPATGAVSSIIVVPASQSLGWKDGYAPLGLSDFNALAAYPNPRLAPNRPMLILLAHDGDNAWGGGFSYYMEATPNLVSQGRVAGYVPTVVEKFLADHPVPADDFVHVEQGAWVNADGDFGSPQFLNWNWPPVLQNGQIDIMNGWAEDIRNWAVITANSNRVETAEQIHTSGGGLVNINRILYPDASTNNAERAWHYFLGGLNSGFMYYGTAGDMEVKPTVSGNRAVQYADAVIGNAAADTTGPTLWTLQRHPWNPGSTNFGPQYGYQQRNLGGDFWVWTFAYDVSGLQSVTLKWRTDADGQNSATDSANETYAGGAGVGAWQSIPMTRRVFPAGNIYNDPGIDFYVMPQYVAEQCGAQITGLSNALVDYYVEAADTRGNVRRSAIEHVWVGSGGGGGGGGGATVTINPNPAQAGQNVTIVYDPTNRPLAGTAQVNIHYGFNQWSPVLPDAAMSPVAGKWQITVPVQATASQLDMVFNNGAGAWDNNGGQDWHFAVSGTQTQWVIDGTRDADSTLVASNAGANLWAGLKGTTLYVATENAGASRDHFVLVAAVPGALRAPMWAKSGQVAAWDAFLAAEGDNSYSGWFDAAGATQSARGAVLEGTIDLAGEFGTLPGSISLAAVRYATADGGALVSSLQVPASVNGNGNLDGTEYVQVPLCSLTGAGCGCNADYNQDGGADNSDVTDLANDIAAGTQSFPPSAPDFNADGGADNSDVTDLANVVAGGPCP